MGRNFGDITYLGNRKKEFIGDAHFHFTFSFKGGAARNTGTFLEGIFKGSPVFGLRPFLSFAILMLKLPNP